MAEASLNDSDDDLFHSDTPSTEMLTMRKPRESSHSSAIVMETSDVDRAKPIANGVPPTESTPLVRLDDERAERSMTKAGKRKK